LTFASRAQRWSPSSLCSQAKAPTPPTATIILPCAKLFRLRLLIAPPSRGADALSSTRPRRKGKHTCRGCNVISSFSSTLLRRKLLMRLARGWRAFGRHAGLHPPSLSCPQRNGVHLQSPLKRLRSAQKSSAFLWPGRLRPRFLSLRGQKLLKAVFAPEQPPSDFPLKGGGLLGWYGKILLVNLDPISVPHTSP